MDKISLVKTPSGFIPADDIAKEVTDKIGLGEEVLVKIYKNVNPAFHRKCMSLIKTLFDNQDKYDSFNIFRYALLIRLGHCKMIILPDGQTVYIPDSMSFAKMDDTKREKVFNDIIDAAVAGKLIGELNRDELILQVLGYS